MSMLTSIQETAIKCSRLTDLETVHGREMGDVAKDLIAGTAGGAAQLVVGHPLGTIKVKLQSQPAPPRYAVRQTLAPGTLQGHGRAPRHRGRLQRAPLHRQGPDGGRAALRSRRAAHHRPGGRRRRRRRGRRLVPGVPRRAHQVQVSCHGKFDI